MFFPLLRITTLATCCHQDQDERHRRQQAWLNVHCLQHLYICPAGHPDACNWRSARHRGFLKKKLQSCVSDHEFFTVCCLIARSGSRRSCVRSKFCRLSGTSTRRLSAGSVLPASCVNLLDSSARGGCLRHMAAWRFGVENWLPKRNGEEE